MTEEIKQNILIGNRLIDNFAPGIKYDAQKPEYQSIFNEYEDLYFHSSWNWLMPVVEKIESLGYRFNISGNFSFVEVGMLEFIGVSRPDNQLSIIENLYDTVVEFIKWYNERTPKQST